MKRKKLSFMNVNDDRLLSRDEMRSITAGCGGNNCRVAYRNADGSFYGYSSCMSCDVASDMYDDGWYDNDVLVYASGYCGASCGSESFPNAEPCY